VLLGNLVGARERHRVLVGHLAAKRVLEPLEALDDFLLALRELFHVLIHALVVEALQHREELIQILRIEAFESAKLRAQLLELGGPLARLAAELTDVLGAQRPRPPAAPAAIVPAQAAAKIGAREGANAVATLEVSAELAAAVLAALPITTLALTLALALALTLALPLPLALLAEARPRLLLTLALALALTLALALALALTLTLTLTLALLTRGLLTLALT
jgi:hypothetical protein